MNLLLADDDQDLRDGVKKSLTANYSSISSFKLHNRSIYIIPHALAKGKRISLLYFHHSCNGCLKFEDFRSTLWPFCRLVTDADRSLGSEKCAKQRVSVAGSTKRLFVLCYCSQPVVCLIISFVFNENIISTQSTSSRPSSLNR